jgi:hypothetical protein
LTSSPAQSEIPAISGDIAQYYADAIATDPGNHLAVAFQPQDYQFDVLGPDVLATYTAESNGDLNTASTYKNMPASDIYGIVAASISPSGKLLAVGGQGFQILHFNGSSPITHYSALLQPNYAFQELGWDNENHLYALSYDQLFVYTVTPTSIKEAPGSPYSIPEVSSIIVLSK